MSLSIIRFGQWPGAACSAAVLLGIFAQVGVRGAGTAGAHAEVLRLQQQQVEVRPAVAITVDATAHGSQNPEAFKRLCERLVNASGVTPDEITRPEGPSTSAAAPVSSPDWYLWARLKSGCSDNLTVDLKDMQIYPVHCDAGGAVCVANSSVAVQPYSLKLRLPKGVFRIEKLSFSPSLPAADSDVSKPKYTSSLTRLQGCDNGATASIVRPGELAPGEVAIIRYTDVAGDARTAMVELLAQLHRLATSTPGPANKLRRIVSQCSGYMAGVTSGAPGTQQKRLGCVHRLILLMSQAESLQRNYQARHTVNVEPGASTMGAIEREEDSLSETSAVLAGLVPQVALSTFEKVASADSSGTSSIVTVATVSVRNTGPHTVNAIKLGLDASALPEGSLCSPDDYAYFGELHPGQAARATFKLTLPASTDPVPALFVADVSYFISGAPAHLRPRPW